MIRSLHIASGLILFCYLLVHFMNHAVVLVSIEAADEVLHPIHGMLGTRPVTALLLAALITHVALALLALWRRRTLRLSPYEAVQYLLGFTLPLALAPHIAGTRVADTITSGAWGYYRNLLSQFWVFAPEQAISQGLLLLGAWIHAMLGLHAWLRLKSWYAALQPVLLAAALLLPTLAFAGFVAGGQEARLRLALEPGFRDQVLADQTPAAVQARVMAIAEGILDGLWLALAAVLLARLARDLLRRRQGLVRVTYPDGRSIGVPRGFSVLEASWLLGVPHASVCGGRGRCSTCRVRVATTSTLPAPGAAEARVLDRIRAAPGIRLACQLRPAGPLGVTPLLDPGLPPRALLRFRAPQMLGEERVVAILFADIRGFTRMAEHRLPFDVVDLLNRYFRAMGEAVEAAGGRVDKFIGDGVMALFGAGPRPAEPVPDEAADARAACRAALDGARRMSLALAALNRTLVAELGEPLRIGIGIHSGSVILGAMGHGRTITATAIGDAVNTASRLEAASKEYACELVVSEAVLEAAGLGAAEMPGEAHEVAVRGRTQPMRVRAVARAAELLRGSN